jgi:hypothetical protein
MNTVNAVKTSRSENKRVELLQGWKWYNGFDLKENCTAIMPSLKTSSERRHYFKHQKNIEKYKIDAGHIYHCEVTIINLVFWSSS